MDEESEKVDVEKRKKEEEEKKNKNEDGLTGSVLLTPPPGGESVAGHDATDTIENDTEIVPDDAVVTPVEVVSGGRILKNL